jgi:hypothetical protein
MERKPKMNQQAICAVQAKQSGTIKATKRTGANEAQHRGTEWGMIRWRDEQSGQATSWYAKLGGWLELEPTPPREGEEENDRRRRNPHARKEMDGPVSKQAA